MLTQHERMENIMNGMNERTPVKFTIRNTMAALILFLAASLLMAFPASANQHMGGKMDMKGEHGAKKGGMKMDMKMGMKKGMKMDMKAASCGRKMMMEQSAEMQMGGAHYKGPMAKKGSMKMDGMKKGMKMGGMKMDGMKKGMKMAANDGEKAHADHEVKMGGVLFMAPNEMHHVEGVYSEKCGFQVFIYNAFTKPIHVGRFRAFIKLIGEVNEEDVERILFLRPNQKGNVLHAIIGSGMKAPFEVELYVKFPEGDTVEVFNFNVDADGKIS